MATVNNLKDLNLPADPPRYNYFSGRAGIPCKWMISGSSPA